MKWIYGRAAKNILRRWRHGRLPGDGRWRQTNKLQHCNALTFLCELPQDLGFGVVSATGINDMCTMCTLCEREQLGTIPRPGGRFACAQELIEVQEPVHETVDVRMRETLRLVERVPKATCRSSLVCQHFESLNVEPWVGASVLAGNNALRTADPRDQKRCVCCGHSPL